MAKWRVGVIGYGWVAGAHIDAINQVPEAEAVAVCTSRELDPTALAAQHGRPIEVLHDLKAMLARPDINVISICSLPHLHAEQAIAAARAGKHIIIEKPLALSLDDCRTVRQAVRESGVHASVCFEVRYSAQFAATRSIIAQGLLGKLHHGECDYCHGIGPHYGQYRWNKKTLDGGSSLLSAGCHAVDGLLLFMDSPVEEVFTYATGSMNPAYAAYEYPTTSVTLMKFANGTLGKVTSTIDCIQPYYLRVHLLGSEGSILDGKLFTNKIAGLRRDRWTELGVELADSGDVFDHPYHAQFTAFFDALDQDKDMPLTNLDDALYTHEVVFAADLSAQRGAPVKMAELG